MASTPVFDPADPAWLAHRYDAAGDRLLFRHVPRAMHPDGPFLTDELIADRPQAIIARPEGVAAARAHAGPVHFLLHSDFCAPTLLLLPIPLPGHALGLPAPAPRTEYNV